MLLEISLLVIAVPLLSLVDSPFVAGAQSASADFTAFFVTIAVACFACGGVFGWWVARPLSSSFVLHGALTGLVATAIYLAICSIPPATIAAVFAAYGPFWFGVANGRPRRSMNTDRIRIRYEAQNRQDGVVAGGHVAP